MCRWGKSFPGRTFAFLLASAGLFAVSGRICTAEDSGALVAKGRWITGAEGVQASGLTVDSDGDLWVVGDLGTTFDSEVGPRLFRVRFGSDGEVGLVAKPFIDGGPDPEGICWSEPDQQFVVVTEGSPERPQLLSVSVRGQVEKARPISNPIGWEGSLGQNRRWEGIACRDDHVLLAFEGSQDGKVAPHIETLQLPPDDGENSPLLSTKLDLDLDHVRSLTGLHLFEWQGQEYLLGVDRNCEQLVRIPLEWSDGGWQARPVARIPVDFRSPEGKGICRAQPEGIAVENESIIWLVSDPVSSSGGGNYRELATTESKAGCSENSADKPAPESGFAKSQPILFKLSLDQVMNAPAAPGGTPLCSDVPKPASVGVNLPSPLSSHRLPASCSDPRQGSKDAPGSRYDQLRSEIHKAGAQGKLRRMEGLLLDLETEAGRAVAVEERTCWQLLKGSVLTDLARYDQARAVFRDQSETCPTWEAFNNLAVLEAMVGDTQSAKENLRRSIQLQGSEDSSTPQGNLRSLESDTERPSLHLAASPQACRETPVPCTVCGLRSQEPTPRPPPPVPPAPPAPPASDRDPAPANPREAIQQAPRGAAFPPLAQPLTTQEAEITLLIERWQRAWEEKRMEDYFSTYSPDFRPDLGISREAWRGVRKQRIGNAQDIRIEVGDLRLTRAGEGEILAEFRQVFRSKAYCDVGQKELLLRRVDGAWRIVEEREVKKEKKGC